MITQFKENDIRPQNLMAEQKKYLAEDIKYLQKQKKKFVSISCPACGANKSKKKYSKYKFKYLECQICQTVFMNPRPTTAIIFNYLDNSKNYKYWNEVIFPASEVSRRQKIFKPRVSNVLKICQKFKITTHSLVEIGSGFGTFLEEMSSRKIFDKVIGIEPSKDWAETCRNKGLKIIDKPIEKVSSKMIQADVAVSFEVIEHIFSPQDFVKACYSILRKKGILILTCPNVKGFDIQVLGVVSDTIDGEHLNYFNPNSLALLLEKQGFKILEKQTPGVLDADLVRNKILNKEFKNNSEFLKTILLDRWDEIGFNFQKFLQKNLLSSNMLIVAQKN